MALRCYSSAIMYCQLFDPLSITSHLSPLIKFVYFTRFNFKERALCPILDTISTFIIGYQGKNDLYIGFLMPQTQFFRYFMCII